MNDILESVRGRLIVSCQAYPGEPLRDPGTMARMARAAVLGGSAAIRAQGLEDIALIRDAVDVPVIGLWKIGSAGVFITPTIESALAVARAGAHVVAVDATRRPRPNGERLADVVAAVHGTGALVMGDVGGVEDAVEAIAAGVDIVGTTIAGYTPDRVNDGGPDIGLVAELARFSPVPVIAEGRIHTPADARRALEAGAHAVVVGTAITHPTSITRWFVEALEPSLAEEA